MADWLDFEKQCTAYLDHKFGEHAAFCHLGSANSTLSDIHVTTKSGRTFYIEAKLAPAQCGQFVLLPDIANQRFLFSNQNKTALTPPVQRIIDHMNADFLSYKEAGTAGKCIDLNDGGKTFSEWIVSMYQSKGTAFFITSDFTIFPIQDFSKHFQVIATYRIKRSGSRSVGVKNAPLIMRHIQSMGYPVQDPRLAGNKLFVCSNASLHNQHFFYNGFEYMFSQRTDKFEIRKLSNTFHANVIFTITQKTHPGLSDEAFIQYLY